MRERTLLTKLEVSRFDNALGPMAFCTLTTLSSAEEGEDFSL